MRQRTAPPIHFEDFLHVGAGRLSRFQCVRKMQRRAGPQEILFFSPVSFKNRRMKIVVAYSGGLDTSIILTVVEGEI